MSGNARPPFFAIPVRDIRSLEAVRVPSQPVHDEHLALVVAVPKSDGEISNHALQSTHSQAGRDQGYANVAAPLAREGGIVGSKPMFQARCRANEAPRPGPGWRAGFFGCSDSGLSIYRGKAIDRNVGFTGLPEHRHLRAV